MNARFKGGAITFPAAEAVKRFRLVQLTEDGVKHADASSKVFGAITQAADPKGNPVDNDLSITPTHVAVHYGPHTVEVEVEGTASDIKRGTAVKAAADGKVTTSGGGATVGVAVSDGRAKTVDVLLLTPTVAAE